MIDPLDLIIVITISFTDLNPNQPYLPLNITNSIKIRFQDLLRSMFPLKPRDELVFAISTTPSSSHNNNTIFHLQTTTTHDLNMTHDLSNYYHTQTFNTTTATSSSTTIDFSTSSNNTTNKLAKGVREVEKRAVHRNIERQRRQEMSQLYASLRSLLPIDQIKGKHSLSDVMHESKSYIQNLQNNVQELRVRRDNIKKLSISSGKETNSSNSKSNSPYYVEVNKNEEGVEILIGNSSESGLSRVMIELASSDMELNVVSCISTKMNGRFLHTIHAEASDMRLVDLSRLQERLTGLINY